MSVLQRIARRIGNDRFLKFMRFYPPYLGAGVSVTRVAKDLSVLEVEMKLAQWNRNFVGTQFGGSLYSMSGATPSRASGRCSACAGKTPRGRRLEGRRYVLVAHS